MKKFVILYLASVISLLVLVVLLNYWVDPADVFSKQAQSKEFSMAKILNNNDNILVNFNYDERLLQKYRIELNRTPKDVVIVGSSRTLQIGSEILRRSSLNVSVSGTAIEDVIALAVLVQKKVHPKVIVLGIDPWMFNKNYVHDGWKSISYEYYSALHEIGRAGYSKNVLFPARYLQLVNYEYSRQSWNLLWNTIRQGGPAFTIGTAEDSLPNSDLLKADGSRLYNKNYAGRDVDSVKKLAVSFAARPSVLLFDNFMLSYDALRDFRHLLDHLAKDTTVIIFLSPFHPSAYPLILQRYNQLEELERAVRREAQMSGVPVFGSYNPGITGCEERDFFDGMHPKAVCVSKILTGFFSRTRSINRLKTTKLDE